MDSNFECRQILSTEVFVKIWHSIYYSSCPIVTNKMIMFHVWKFSCKRRNTVRQSLIIIHLSHPWCSQYFLYIFLHRSMVIYKIPKKVWIKFHIMGYSCRFFDQFLLRFLESGFLWKKGRPEYDLWCVSWVISHSSQYFVHELERIPTPN